MEKVITGWEIGKRTHFDEIVANYDRIRTEYPAELFEDVIKYAGLGRGGKALEIGAGTGKATSPFLDAGYNVTAVEIGENMAEFLREKYIGYKDFTVVNSAFEDAVLEEESYDLIYAASAFHWVNAQIGCPKAFRLLKYGGTLALLRYNFNIIPADGEENCDEIQAVYDKHFYNYYKPNGKAVRMTKERFEASPQILRGYGCKDLSLYGFSDISMNLYDAIRTYSADEWITLLNTLSDHRSLPEDNRAALFAGIKQAIVRRGGIHKVAYVFQLYMGKRL